VWREEEEGSGEEGFRAGRGGAGDEKDMSVKGDRKYVCA
jgi:hypothetical protein